MSGEERVFNEIVKAVCRFKGGSLYVLAKELELSREEIDRVVSFLLAEGFLKELKINGDCSSCPLSRICPYSGKPGMELPSKRTVYVLSAKGKSFCKDLS